MKYLSLLVVLLSSFQGFSKEIKDKEFKQVFSCTRAELGCKKIGGCCSENYQKAESYVKQMNELPNKCHAQLIQFTSEEKDTRVILSKKCSLLRAHSMFSCPGSSTARNLTNEMKLCVHSKTPIAPSAVPESAATK